jgi:hypothetical protein
MPREVREELKGLRALTKYQLRLEPSSFHHDHDPSLIAVQCQFTIYGPRNKYGAALDPKESMCFEMSTLRVSSKVGVIRN